MKKRSFIHKAVLTAIVVIPVPFFFAGIWGPAYQDNLSLKRQGEINQMEFDLREYASMAAMMGIGFASVVGAAYYDVYNLPSDV